MTLNINPFRPILDDVTVVNIEVEQGVEYFGWNWELYSNTGTSENISNGSGESTNNVGV